MTSFAYTTDSPAAVRDSAPPTCLLRHPRAAHPDRPQPVPAPRDTPPAHASSFAASRVLPPRQCPSAAMNGAGSKPAYEPVTRHSSSLSAGGVSSRSRRIARKEHEDLTRPRDQRLQSLRTVVIRRQHAAAKAAAAFPSASYSSWSRRSRGETVTPYLRSNGGAEYKILWRCRISACSIANTSTLDRHSGFGQRKWQADGPPRPTRAPRRPQRASCSPSAFFAMTRTFMSDRFS